MEKFNKTVVTNVGRQQLASIAGGQGKLTYTKAALFTQNVNDLSQDEILNLTSLSGNQLETNIQVIKVNTNNITVSASFNNSTLSQDINFDSIGWYASTTVDSDEKLFAITPSFTAQTLVAGSNSKSTASFDINLNIGLSQSVDVVIQPQEAGFIDQSKLQAALSELKSSGLINNGDEAVDKEDLAKRFTTSILYINGENTLNVPSGFSNHGQLLSIGSNDTAHDAVHILYDTQNNKEYIQTFDSAANKWSKWTTSTDIFYTKDEINKKFDSINDIVGPQLDTTKAEINKSIINTNQKIDNLANIDIKAIKDKLSKLDGDIDYEGINADLITDTGVYYVNPKGAQHYASDSSSVLVVQSTNNGKNVVQWQIDGGFHVRYKSDGAWTDWAQFTTYDQFDYLNSAISGLEDKVQGNKTDIESKLENAKQALQKAIALKPDSSNTYTKGEVDNLVNPKVIDAPTDINKFTTNGTYKMRNPNNTNTPPWIHDHRGQLINYNYDGNAKTQIWLPVGTGATGGDLAYRYWEGSNAPDWIRLSTYQELQTVQRDLQSKIDIRRPIYYGNNGEDILSFNSPQIRIYTNATNIKNLPPMNRSNYFYVEYFISAWGQVVLHDQDSYLWINSKNGDYWTGWRKVVVSNDLGNLNGDNTYNNPNFNNLTTSGNYYISNPTTANNAPTTNWGNLIVAKGQLQRIQQIYFEDGTNNSMFIRMYYNNSHTAWSPWHRVLADYDFNNLQNQINGKASNQAVTNAQNTANNANANANNRLSKIGTDNMAPTAFINWISNIANGNRGNLGGIGWYGATDWVKIYGAQTGPDNLDLVFELGDDNSNSIVYRWNGAEKARITSSGQFTGTIDWNHVNGRPGNIANTGQISDLQNQINQIRSTMPVVQKFSDINQAKNWSNAGGSQLRIALIN
ncbi:hypothetical protein J2Z60_001082 [Lactobacillus colini]|uniref:Uncharacterized protein n=1 Tax=Lactobacillus colini TaxID=1819254 RepID=A0ABS4MDZ9_9LACO|nr:pyocin knob domain-containing protein [Lactobacillus colini]MBP2057907.1 hypothetical protein [Lactobacillus colini]